MTNKDKYRDLCEKENSIPLFSQAWGLDAVCGGDAWDVVLVEKGGKISASLPYVIAEKRFGFKIVTTPPLTQYLGPKFFHAPVVKLAKKLSTEKDLFVNIFSQLEQYSSYQQNWHNSITNWLPLYWKGYSQTTRFTYVLNNLKDIDSLYKDLQSNIRKEIKKSLRLGVKIDDSATIDEFIELNEKVFKRQRLSLPYSKQMVKDLYLEAKSRHQAKLFIAKDEEGNAHAGNLIVWDNNTAYYLMGGGDPELRTSGATSFCMWEAIQFASTVTQSFDFEGSMLEPVERFFRAFGAEQVPYHAVTKVYSKRMRILYSFRDLARAIFK